VFAGPSLAGASGTLLILCLLKSVNTTAMAAAASPALAAVTPDARGEVPASSAETMPAVKEAATLLRVSTRRIHQMRDGRTAGLQRRTAATDAPRLAGSIPAAGTVAGLQDADFGLVGTTWVGTWATEKIVVGALTVAHPAWSPLDGTEGQQSAVFRSARAEAAFVARHGRGIEKAEGRSTRHQRYG